MEKDFSNENMEEFLRQSADSLRMRPSAKVWKGISKNLNRRRRIRLIWGTSLVVATALGYHLLNESSNPSNHATANPVIKTHPAAQPSIAEQSTPEKKTTHFTGRVVPPRPSIALSSTEPGIGFLALAPKNPVNLSTESTSDSFTPTIADSYLESEKDQQKEPSHLNNSITQKDPPTIESVVNSYQPLSRRKLSLQTYFTPTISYRKLNDSHIDNVAAHKPAFGFELGLAAKYPLSKNLKFRGGLQFNVNRYEIKTYDSYAQTATIRLNDPNGGVDFVRTSTNYNNFSGYKSSWIQNFYFQLSAPLGLELKLKGDDRMQFGVASTLQPTYLLSDRAYLISSDYSNYVKMPQLVRRWNLNTSLETYVAYSTGHLNWQVGPQVRYQLLSSYQKRYPVKENLFDFGLRVGISLNKK